MLHFLQWSSMSSLLQYRTQKGKEDSSLFLAYHPCDILKSKLVNILVTYCSWVKRVFQHWICLRTPRHSLQILNKLHNNLHNLQATGKFYSKRDYPFSSRNLVFLFKRPKQNKQKFKSANPAIFAVFKYKNVQFSTGIFLQK